MSLDPFFQSQSKEQQAAALLIANKELIFQNEEKEKRALELIIANRELLFQNTEKQNRAAELAIANKELIFQNDEKEKRAGELIIANRELLFQNTEKENRAAELIIANKELLFQNKEKEKRASELIISNHELKKTEAELKMVNEDLDSFSYSVSHDLRAPLRAINGYARILEEDYNPLFDDEGKRLLKEVQNNARKMGVLIDDLLAFSRLGRKEVNKYVINMNDLTEKVLSEINESIPHQAEIKFSGLLPAFADSTLLEHVMINLISNALKYSSKSKKPVIAITSKKEKGFTVYAVHDNGVGFDMRYEHKLFGVFQRLHSAEEFPGTGVGLAIVQRIIQKHKGKIWAEGIVGEGASFYFSLPENK